MKNSFRISERSSWYIGIVIAGLLAFGTFREWHTPGVDVIVKNGSGIPLRDVYIRFAGGIKSIPSILPAHAESVRVNPSSASHLELEFRRGRDDYRNGVIDL